MKKFTKILSLVLVLALVIAGTVSVTVAYLTDTAEDKLNTFAVGDVSISLKEEVDVEGGATVETTPNGATFENVMPGDVLTKKVTVTNTDKTNAAYVAVVVTINNAGQLNDAIDDYYEPQGYTDAQIQAIYDEVFPGWGIRYNKLDDNGEHLGMRLTNQRATDATLLHVDSAKSTKIYDNNYLYAYDNWFQSDVEQANTNSAAPKYGFIKDHTQGYYYNGNETIGTPAMNDYEIRYTYFVKLEPGQSYVPFDALYAPTYFDNAQMEMFQNLNITVDAAAIQADNFTSDFDAFAALYGYEIPA